MSGDTDSQFFVSLNENVSYASLFYSHGDQNEDSEKQDIVTNKYF